MYFWFAVTNHTGYFIYFLDFKREKVRNMSFLPFSSTSGRSELSVAPGRHGPKSLHPHFPSLPNPILLDVQHRRWREVLEAGEASEEVWDGAGEVAVVKGQHLQLLHGVDERK
jgi:hypothetical protein